jgi:RNA polymerase sigma-70 factor (ECF subfamily)
MPAWTCYFPATENLFQGTTGVPSDTSRLDPSALRALLARVATGDASAFRTLYDNTSPKLFGFALRILQRRELAEDVLQESFAAVWHSARDYRPHLSAPMTWMATIVRNKAFDALRATDRAVEIDGADFDEAVLRALADPGATPIESLQMSRDAKALAGCMAQLDSTHRQVVGMAFFHDLSHSELAQQLALPIGTVKTWIRRSLERLRTCLGKQESA